MRLLSLCILHIALVVTGELYIYDMIISCLELACQDKRLSCYPIKATIFSTLTRADFPGIPAREILGIPEKIISRFPGKKI